MRATSCDLVIRGGAVYDGTGAEPVRSDVYVRGDRIVALSDAGAALEGHAGAEIDARGLAVAPGFIDVHTHDDVAVFQYPDMGFKTRQGVTTCVLGNCGLGPAPREALRRLLEAELRGPTLPDWVGHAGYLERLASEPPAVNTALLIGHGILRFAAMGEAKRAPSATELDDMRANVREGAEAGAFGLSTGLVYEPGRWAETDEIVELARALEGRGLYATHMRNEGAALLEAVDEAIAIGEAAGVPVQISHHKASGRDAWGKVRESLQRIERARARGLDVTADQYPYTAGSTTLAAVVQNGAFVPDAKSGLGRLDPADVRICSCPSSPELEGLGLEAVAQRLGTSGAEAADRLLDVDGNGVIVALETMDEADVRCVMAHPTTMIGSDGIAVLEGKPHPRLYGTFARVLGRYARELSVLSLAEAVHRMTGMPAAKFGMRDRGAIREGAFADLVVFDPETVLDTATFDDPHRAPEGIPHVLVNGVAVVRDGEPTGARPGRPLRRGD
jgi:N-acyl-D-amino-acid deacylase